MVSEALGKRQLKKSVLLLQRHRPFLSSYLFFHKIEEILETGELQRIKYETTKDVEVTRLFQGIYGVGKDPVCVLLLTTLIKPIVGQNISFQWYSAGCRTLEDLRSDKGGVKLNHVQEIGLRFYDGKCCLIEEGRFRESTNTTIVRRYQRSNATGRSKGDIRPRQTDW